MHDFTSALFWVSAAVLCYAYIGYPLIMLAVRLLPDRRLPDPSDDDAPTVAVVIAAHNEESHIRQRLANVLTQDYPADKLSVVVASDASSDDTVGVARSVGDPRVTVLDFPTRRGKLGTLNEAVKHAAADILIFTDANCQFDRDAVRRLAARFADPRVGCVAGSKNIIEVDRRTATTHRGEGLYWRFESFLKSSENRLGSCCTTDGSIYALRRPLYPFPRVDRLVMDDFFVYLSVVLAGHACTYEERARSYEPSSAGLRAELRRKGRILAGQINVLILLPQALLPFRSPIAFQLWSHKVLRWFGGILLPVALLANVALAPSHGVYSNLLAAQLAFYGLGVLGYLLSVHGRASRLLNVPYYFLFMNYAQLAGLVTLVREGRRVSWDRVGR